MRITNVTSSLQNGGAESSMTLLSNLWLQAGKQVSVVVTSFEEHDLQSGLSPSIPIAAVVGSKVAQKWPHRMKTLGVLLALRKAILGTRPDVIVAYTDTVAINTLLAATGSGIPVIVVEHCDPNARPLGIPTVPTGPYVPAPRLKLLEVYRKLLYPLAASVVCLTETAMSFFPPSVQKKGRVIPNPVLPPANLGGRLAQPSRRIVYLGRFTAVKGLDRLLHAYSRIATLHPDWCVELWGCGEEEARLKQLARKLGVEAAVRFRGWTDNPHEALKGAGLFVLPSQTEGFPMALCEAMACGVPPISFDCPSGPRNIIRHGTDGLLVRNGDVDGLARAMEYLINNKTERHRLASRAPEVVERFAAGKVLKMWDSLFQDVLICE